MATRQQLSQWWAKRGDARDAIDSAERALLEALQIISAADPIGMHVRSALGCLSGARELLAIATEGVNAEARKLDREAKGGDES